MIKLATTFLSTTLTIIVMMTAPSHANSLTIDDRSSNSLRSNLGTEWRFVADQVMGGVSSGNIKLDSYKDKPCLRLSGEVSTANNGGFVQMALNLGTGKHFDASAYNALRITVAGNNEEYNLHIRTADLWLPWQSYRAGFKAGENWQTITLPFSSLESYKTSRRFRADRIKRIGMVAIGRNFQASLCLHSVELVNTTDKQVM